MLRFMSVLVLISIIFISGCTKSCADYSPDNCPSSCVVCPPCEVCSSISCQTEEFCEKMGFNRSWYESIQKRLGSSVTIDERFTAVEIADNYFERTKGLMSRDSLCIDCGMLFVFEQDDVQTFWMKDTHMPLDMVFIDSSYTVVELIRAVPCEKDPCHEYTSRAKARYVLEVNAYTFDDSILGKKADVIIR